MKNKIDFHKETQKILKQADKEQEKYFFETDGKKFVTYRGVFPAKYFSDTKFFAKNIPSKKGKALLEIGSGTGVISIFMALKGMKVVATDINPLAVENTKENVKSYNLSKSVKVLKGDLFEPVKNKKFDIIFWNYPFCYSENKNLKINERAVSDYKYEGLKKFAKDAKKHLNKKGKILIGFSTTIGNYQRFKEIIEKENLKPKIIAQKIDGQGNKKATGEEHPKVKYELFDLISNPKT